MATATPKYFDYLHEHGQYLTERFGFGPNLENGSLEADIAFYRRRQSNDKRTWTAAVYVRRLLERIVNTLLGSHVGEFGEMLGEKLYWGIKLEYLPRSLGHMMEELNRRVRDGAHIKPYAQDDLALALIQLDDVFRTILTSANKEISGDEVKKGTDDVLLAHSDSIEEKARVAAQLTGNEQLAEEGRRANERALAAESALEEARRQEEQIERENEQLRLELEAAMQTINDQLAALSKKAADYDALVRKNDEMATAVSEQKARADAKAAELEQLQAAQDAKLAEARELRRAKEAARDEAADRVTELEEQLDDILSEHDFIKTLLGKRGTATAEQSRIVNYFLDPAHKTKLLRVVGRAGSGKTLCLLAAVINTLEPHGQGTLSFDDQTEERKALFICFNRDLAEYMRGLLEAFPDIRERIEVANYDQFLNQLVRTNPIDGYEHLAEYASDVRYPYIRHGSKHYWSLVVDEDEKKAFVRRAIEEVRSYYENNGYQQYCSSSLLDARDDSNVAWMVDEIEWLEGRYHSIEEGQTLYPSAERVGRGSGRRLTRNSPERTHVTNVWLAFQNILKNEHRYTLEQMVTRLLGSQQLPTYDIVAIDEVQDLNIMHIELFLKFRSEEGYLIIAGDEGQRVYPRDFMWRQVDERIRPYTLTLSKNMRNPEEVQAFAERLLGNARSGEGQVSSSQSLVRVVREPRESVVEYIKGLAKHGDETTAIVTSEIGAWVKLLRGARIALATENGPRASNENIRMENGAIQPGVYCFTQLRAKGLEFDNVIVDYTSELDSQDYGREKRIRYMQFTRARKTLLVRYEGEPPKLLKEYYSDYLAG